MEFIRNEIFELQPGRGLPAVDRQCAGGGGRAMRNIWTICRRELYAYFVSPIAWVLLTIFALLSGVFAYDMAALFVRAGFESQMQGQSFPMNVNEQVLAPLLSNISVIGLFLIPLISMRLFAEEKRQGT